MKFLVLPTDVPGLSEYVTVAGTTQTITKALTLNATATSAFSVNNASGTAGLTVNTSNRRVTVGTVGATSLFNVQAADSVSTQTSQRTYGSATGNVNSYVAARGTSASPTQTVGGDSLQTVKWIGRDDASANPVAAQLDVTALDDYSSGGYSPVSYRLQLNDSSTLVQAFKVVGYDPNSGYAGYMIVGSSSADTLGIPGNLTVQQSQNLPGFMLTGTGTDGVGDDAGGVVFYMTHNALSNRQLCFGASENYGSFGASAFRFLFSTTVASIDAVTADGSFRLNCNIGTDTTGLSVGNHSAAYNVSLPGVLSVYGRNGVPSAVVLANASGTDDLQQWTSSGGTVRAKITNAGDLKLNAVGTGLYVKEGTNATMGRATLSGGTVTVSTTKVTANSEILLTVQSLGTVAVPKAVGVTARIAGTSFTITSADATDTSVVAWFIAEPA